METSRERDRERESPGPEGNEPIVDRPCFSQYNVDDRFHFPTHRTKQGHVPCTMTALCHKQNGKRLMTEIETAFCVGADACVTMAIRRQQRSKRAVGLSKFLSVLVGILVLTILVFNLRAASSLGNATIDGGRHQQHPPNASSGVMDWSKQEKRQVSKPPATPSQQQQQDKKQPQKQPGSLPKDDDIDQIQALLVQTFDSLPPPLYPDDDTKHDHTNNIAIPNLRKRTRDAVGTTDVTLVSHGSVPKLPPLLDQVQRWQGPVSFVIYISNHQEIEEFCRFLRTDATSLLLELTSIHAIVEKHGGRLPYPVNTARNLAQRSIESDFFLLMDGDFLPSAGAYRFLLEKLTSQEEGDSTDSMQRRLREGKTLYVLPAFERKPLTADGTATADLIPNDKEDLIGMCREDTVMAFHPYFVPGHFPTNYTEWFRDVEAPRPANSENKASPDKKTVSIIGSNKNHDDGGHDDYSYPTTYLKRFEPYVVASRHGIPDFWPQFRGFGYNAATWFWELHLAGYKYRVLRDHFVVHMNHPGRCERRIEETSFAKEELPRFIDNIKQKYDGATAQACKEWQRSIYRHRQKRNAFCHGRGVQRMC